MYRRQNSGGISTFTVVILLGVAAGVFYLSSENAVVAPPEPAAVIPTPTAAEPTAAPVSTSVEATPIATPLPREETEGASFYAPTAGIVGNVVETYLDGTSWDVKQLGPNVGHLEGTGWLDVPGNIVLAGHVELADGRPGIFADLPKLQIGDQVILTQNGQDRVYEVRQKFKTEPSDLTVVYPTTSERLTLITCSNYDFLEDRYDTRFVVIAERLS